MPCGSDVATNDIVDVVREPPTVLAVTMPWRPQGIDSNKVVSFFFLIKVWVDACNLRLSHVCKRKCVVAILDGMCVTSPTVRPTVRIAMVLAHVCRNLTHSSDGRKRYRVVTCSLGR
jgi:hypothetical protein